MINWYFLYGDRNFISLQWSLNSMFQPEKELCKLFGDNRQAPMNKLLLVADSVVANTWDVFRNVSDPYNLESGSRINRARSIIN